MLQRKKRENNYFAIWSDVTMLLWGLGLTLGQWYIFSILVIMMCCSIYLYYILLEYKVSKWQKVGGTYKRFSLQTLKVWDGGRNLYTRYRLYVSYEYMVDQKKYQSDRLSIYNKDYAMWKEESASKLVKKNQEDKSLTVYYNPKNPEESMLIPRHSSGMRFRLYLYLFYGVTLSIRVGWHLWG